ncbi:gustatory and odorant receptor 63a-like [Planococcus citri]|uniref:gustatory and odorant receptor 63a-like n=1 Tax=Planococcus citri TaxID=170843 RepID=UPI0031F74E21
MDTISRRIRFPRIFFGSRPSSSEVDLTKDNINEKASKALEWKMDYTEKPQVYHMTISLVFDILRLMGRAPFYRDSTGKMEYKFCSAIMLYSVVIYLLVGVSSLFSLIDLFSDKKTSFNSQVDGALTSFMIAPQLITPVLSWIQMRSHQEYLDKWVVFQEKYEQVTMNNFPRVKFSVVKMCLFVFSFVLMIVLIIPHYLIDNLRWYHFPGYLFNVVGTLCHFVYWKLTSSMITIISKKFHENFRKEVVNAKGYTAKIEDYRLLWMTLSQLIQNCGSSSCGIVSVFIITNMIYLVCIIYNTGFDSLEHYKSSNFHSIIAAVLVTIFWWVILMTYCEAGYKMTESSMQGILHSILEIKNHNILSYEDELHVNIFLHTLKQYSSEATVSDYFVINRSLFGSIITALVTYVIVMIQFHVNNVSSTAQLPANNVSAPLSQGPAPTTPSNKDNDTTLYDYTAE